MLKKIKVFSMLSLLLIVTMFVGCINFVVVTEKIEIDYNTIPTDITVKDFELSKIALVVHKPKGDVSKVALSEKYISEEDFELLKSAGTHSITVYYDELQTKFTVTLLEKYADIIVSFVTGTDFDNNPYVCEKYSLVTILNSPIKKGYDFDGWYLDSNLVNKYTPKKLDKDLTLYAKWKGQPNIVSFDFGYELPDYGKVLEKQTVNSGEVPIRPALLDRPGYRFVGWYLDSEYKNEFNFAKIVEESFTVYAKWDKK